LGADPHEIRHAISPRNGFRFSEGGGRIAAVPTGIHATNLVVESHHPMSDGDLLRSIGNGLYIGRLWYTYPVGGIASGIISGTVIADSYVIRDGQLAEPILPNSLRLEDNLGGMVRNIVGIGGNQIPTILWASDEVTHAPWVGMSGVRFLSINQ
jgi:PmbA protein